MQWLPPFDEDAAKGALREHDADVQPPLLSRHAGAVRQRAGRPEHGRVRGLSERHRRSATRSRGIAPTMSTPIPGSIVMVRGSGGGGRGAGGGGGGGAAEGPPGQAAASSSSRPIGRACSIKGTVNDKNPLEVGPKTFLDRVAIKSGEKKRVYESENTDVFERIATVIDPDVPRLIVSRERPAEVPQNYLVDGAMLVRSSRRTRTTRRTSRSAREAAVHGRAAGRLQVQGQRHAAAGLPGRHAAAGDVLVLSARVHDAGGVRPDGAHVQQEQVPELRHALDGVPRAAGLRGRRARRADLRPAGADERQLRERPAQQPRGDHRRARSARR